MAKILKKGWFTCGRFHISSARLHYTSAWFRVSGVDSDIEGASLRLPSQSGDRSQHSPPHHFDGLWAFVFRLWSLQGTHDDGG